MDITGWFNTEIKSLFQFSNNQIQEQNNQTITQQVHTFNLHFYPKEQYYIGVKTDYINNNLFSQNNENIFSDILCRYTWKKKGVDFELQLNNIFNNDSYKTITVDNFSYLESNFILRPRQLLLKVSFSI